MTAKFPLDHISASFIKAYMDCHLKGHYYKIRAPSTFDPRYAECGSVVHSAIERQYNPLAEEYTANPDLMDGQMVQRANESVEGFKMIARRLPRLTPGKGQQAEVEIKWYPEVDVLFLGYIDLLTVGPTTYIDDWKTGAEGPKDELQMRLYKVAVSETMGIPTRNIITTLHYLRQAKSKEVPFDGIRETRHWLKVNVIDPVRDMDFTPNVGSQCARCEYRTICDAWKN